MTEQEVLTFLESPKMKPIELQKKIIATSKELLDHETNAEAIRNDYMYSIQASTNSPDSVKVQSSNIPNVAKTLEQVNMMMKETKRNLNIQLTKDSNDLASATRLYFIKGSLKPYDRQLIKLRLEEALKWEAIEYEMGKDRKTLRQDLNKIIINITNCYNSNMPDSYYANHRNIDLYSKGKRSSIMIKGQEQLEFNQYLTDDDSRKEQ